MSKTLFSIERTANGWIICSKVKGDPESLQKFVMEEGASEHQAFARLLREMAQECGPSDGRYSEERIVVSVLPGDKKEGQNSEAVIEEAQELASRCISVLAKESLFRKEIGLAAIDFWSKPVEAAVLKDRDEDV